MLVKVKAKDADASHCLNAALRLLSRREYSLKELSVKLLTKYQRDAVSETLKRCVDENWQSDERYADMLLRHMQSLSYGPVRFKMDALKKGISSSIINPLIMQTDWDDIAIKFLQKKLSVDEELTFENKQKILQTLFRRGFLKETCFKALDLFLQYKQ